MLAAILFGGMIAGILHLGTACIGILLLVMSLYLGAAVLCGSRILRETSR